MGRVRGCGVRGCGVRGCGLERNYKDKGKISRKKGEENREVR